MLIPLGAGLLMVSSLATDPPGAERRPAPSFPPLEYSQPVVEQPSFDVRAKVDSIEAEPIRAAFLETVISQGTVGDKIAAIRELRQLPDAAAVAILSLSMNDEDPRVRRAAAAALARIGSDDAHAALASGMYDHDPSRRAQAVDYLAMAGGYSAVDYLDLALRDDDARVRASAIEALGDIGDSRAVNIIGSALRDEDPEVRERAAEMLDQLSDEALFHAVYPPQ